MLGTAGRKQSTAIGAEMAVKFPVARCRLWRLTGMFPSGLVLGGNYFE
jgi:hypothetical protein